MTYEEREREALLAGARRYEQVIGEDPASRDQKIAAMREAIEVYQLTLTD
ncbi:hypothetical protein [Paracoccus suum]|nr:hypothetical protein [Paracoccus suum]